MTNSDETRNPWGAGLTNRGWSLTGKFAKSGAGIVFAVAFALLGSGLVLAQNKDLSEKSVATLMRYAWQTTLPQFTEDGKTIHIDKSKPNDVVISQEAAVEVIRGAYRSYEAELCGLNEEAHANFKTVIERGKAKYKWSEQQFVFGRQLHLATVWYTKGAMRLTGRDDNKEVELLKIPPRDPKECSDERRDRVQKAVTEYINAASPPAAKTAEPVKTDTKKK